jgi:succinate dehydrogenase/fumarate reductase flavoprotein subunit
MTVRSAFSVSSIVRWTRSGSLPEDFRLGRGERSAREIMASGHEIQTDVLVIGGGVAGAFAAIKAREKGAEVTLVDKAFFGRSGCSGLASGVYGTYMPGDDVEAWIKAACTTPLVNRRLAEKAIFRTYDLLMEMDRWGVKWVKEGGKIVRQFGGGSGLPFRTNAMMAEGGPQMMMALRGATLNKGVRVVNRVMATALLTSDGRHPTEGKVAGVVGIHTRSGEPWIFKAKATVLATGPYLFPYAPIGKGFYGMPINASADGIAMMFQAGAILGKMEFGGGSLRPVEFHCAPALEMLGGLGCRFVNDRGEDIISMAGKQGKYSVAVEMRGRRSALSNAIVKEMKAGRKVFLDATHFTPEQHRLVRQVVPIVVNTFERGGYDLSKDGIPYGSTFAATSGTSGGGVRLNERCETSIEGLYAAGNCTDGAYISMGQALPGSSVLGAWAGENAGEWVRGCGDIQPDGSQVEALIGEALAPLEAGRGVTYDEVHGKLERILSEEVDHILNGTRLERALEEIRQIKAESLPRLKAADPHELAKVNGLKSFVTAFEPALAVLLRRKESRGNVLREDYPEIDDLHWASFTVCRMEGGGRLKLWEEPVPEDGDHLRVEKRKVIHPFFQ